MESFFHTLKTEWVMHCDYKTRDHARELVGGLEDRLYDRVKNWIKTDWPFTSVAFPGRDIAWDIWKAIPTEPR